MLAARREASNPAAGEEMRGHSARRSGRADEGRRSFDAALALGSKRPTLFEPRIRLALAS